MYDRCGEVVIKDDLRIAGERVKIVSKNKIQIDCEFEGDVTGPEVVVSERGKVTGNVAGDRVIVLGKIVGDIRGKVVALLSTAHVEGDNCRRRRAVATNPATVTLLAIDQFHTASVGTNAQLCEGVSRDGVLELPSLRLLTSWPRREVFSRSAPIRNSGFAGVRHIAMSRLSTELIGRNGDRRYQPK